MQESLGKRGTAIVAVITVAVVAGALWFTFGRDGLQGTPIEDAAAGRPITASSDLSLPQGRAAPDSGEGSVGSAIQATGVTDPDVNPNPPATVGTGRNAPAAPGDAPAQ